MSRSEKGEDPTSVFIGDADVAHRAVSQRRADRAGADQRKMSSSPTTAKKRKADEISDESVADVPHLPPPVWGGILDFLPYAEVRSALLVGKHIAVEAVAYVRTLNIMRASEMYVPATRRFTNISEVNILGLLVGTGKMNSEGYEMYSLSSDAVGRTVGFLTSFPKLEKFYLGGFLYREGRRGIRQRHHYNQELERNDSKDEDHKLLLGIIASLCGAFKIGLFSNVNKVGGVFESTLRYCLPCGHRNRNSAPGPNPCSLCKDICETFPIATLLRADVMEANATHSISVGGFSCMKPIQFLKLISQRPGARRKLLEASETFLCDWLRITFNRLVVTDPSPAFRRKLEEQGKMRLEVVCIHSSFYKVLDDFIAIGFDPKRVSRGYFWAEFSDVIGIGNGTHDCYYIWKRSTAERLAELGFPVQCDEIPVINDEEIRSDVDESDGLEYILIDSSSDEELD